MNKFPVLAIVALIAAMLACQAIIPARPPSNTTDLGCRETIAAIKTVRS